MLLPTALAAGDAKVYVLSDKTYFHQRCGYGLKTARFNFQFYATDKRLNNKEYNNAKVQAWIF